MSYYNYQNGANPNVNPVDTNEDEDDPNRTYCICNGKDDGRFMIYCEKCKNWFHGECVHVTAKEAESIEYYVCPLCRQKEVDATKRPRDDEPDSAPVKKAKTDYPEVWSGTIEKKPIPAFNISARLLSGEYNNVLPQNIEISGRMDLNALLDYFYKLKRQSNANRKFILLHLESDNSASFEEIYSALVDRSKASVIKLEDKSQEVYMIPVTDQKLPAFMELNSENEKIVLPTELSHHVLIVIVSRKDSAPAPATTSTTTTTSTTAAKESTEAAASTAPAQ